MVALRAAKRWGPDLVLLVAGFLIGAALARGPGDRSGDQPADLPAAASTERPPASARPRPAPVRARPDEDPELAEIRAEIRDLEAEGRRIGALPAPWPDDAAPDLLPDAVRADFARLVAEQSEHFEGVQTRVDCSEYPCVVIYALDATVAEPPPPRFEEGYREYSATDGELSRHVYEPLVRGVERRLEARVRQLMADP